MGDKMSLYGLHDVIPVQLGATPKLKLYVKSSNGWVPEHRVNWEEEGEIEELDFRLGTDYKNPVAEAIIAYVPYWKAVDIYRDYGFEDPEEYAQNHHITKIAYILVRPQFYGKGYGLEILKRLKSYVHGDVVADMFSQRIFEHLYKVFGLPTQINPQPDDTFLRPKLPEEVKSYLDLNPELSPYTYMGFPRLTNERHVFAMWEK